MIGSLVVSTSGRQARPGRSEAVGRRGRGDRVERVLLRQHARTGAEHIAPELRLAFVDPQQAVLHRRAIVGRPQVGGAAKLAVPAVAEFVRQQVAVAQLVFPVGEIAAADAVLRAAVMLEPVAAEIVRDGQQEVVMIVMLARRTLSPPVRPAACAPRSARALPRARPRCRR